MLENILNFISQKYFYIPASVIGALCVIIPAIVKVVKIASSTAVLNAKIIRLSKKCETLEHDCKILAEARSCDLIAEKNNLIDCNKLIINKKQKELNNNRVAYIDGEIKKCDLFLITKEVEQEKVNQKKIKVKVK